MLRIANKPEVNPRQLEADTIAWLMQGDPSIRWQVLSDLLREDRATVDAERQEVAKCGWGAQLLSYQDSSGMWGGGIYSPKWISTTYTLLTLRFLGLPPENPQAQAGCERLLERSFYRDGGINISKSQNISEACVTGMVLSILAYFRHEDERVDRLPTHLLERQMPDGGWNCEDYRGATHASFHTTLSVLEGLLEYRNLRENMGAEREKATGDFVHAEKKGHEFLLQHRLFRSHRTGEVVDPRMLRYPFPPRWHYDTLRALDYFQKYSRRENLWNEEPVKLDPRFEDAIGVLKRKRTAEGRWPAYRGASGRTYFEMEAAGTPGRWNTLRALRVLSWWEGGV
jgi:hypothetical protein